MQNFYATLKSTLMLTFWLFALGATAQSVSVVVPNDLINSDLASANLPGWRMLATGNASIGLVAVADFGIPEINGPHSIRATRPGGAGNNRSFLGYYEAGRTLSQVQQVRWNRYSEIGNDSYLNIFITNGSAIATVVYQPPISTGSWQTFQFSNSATGNISVRIGGSVIDLSFQQLMNQFGNWTIYNHPNTSSFELELLDDFIGGIVLVSGSSSPTAAQTHTFDGVVLRFAGELPTQYDFVAPPIAPPAGCYASQVVDYSPGTRRNFTPLKPSRTLAGNALGVPENSDAATPENALNFVSLGFGGSITLFMDEPIKNGPGNDLRVVETTFGNAAGNCAAYPEKADVFASQDGCIWQYLGRTCQDGEFDLGILNWARFIRVVDVSNRNDFSNPGDDGFDLDGIECLNGPESNPILQDFNLFYATSVVPSSFNQGLRRNGTPVLPARSNPNQALFAPENNNTINFVSLGFGGSIILKLDHVIFDKPGIDLQVVETSFGNPACNSYPERARIEVSLNGSEFTSLGILCQDGTVDFALANVYAAQYIKIVDVSSPGSFGATADGYDVDGVIAIQAGCGNFPVLKTLSEQQLWFTDDTPELVLYPNPSNGPAQLEIYPSMDEMLTISIVNVMGQMVYKQNLNVNKGIMQNVQLPHLPTGAGIYFVHVESIRGRETMKWIRQ